MSFVGRDDTVSRITDRFIKHHKRIVVLLAPPGFGKSSVAIHVGHALKNHGTSVIFLSVRQKNFNGLYLYIHFENLGTSVLDK
jgi:ATP/maltotriose-dependent transcriptional regulator MalT